MKDETLLMVAILSVIVVIILLRCGSRSSYQVLSEMNPLSPSPRSGMVLGEDGTPYSNEPHPVLQYQLRASKMTHPANYGDPIRPLGIGARPNY
jgi:hypothetical protein